MSIASAILASVLLVIAQENSRPPETPDVVYELAADGEFNPGDFSYLRGAYPGASDEQQEEWKEVSDWLADCRQKKKAELSYNLTYLDVELSDAYVSRGGPFCASVITPADLPGITEFSQIEAGLPAARLVFATLVDTLVEAYPGYGEGKDLAFVDLLWLERRIDLLRGVPGGPLVSRPADGRRFPELDDNQNAVLQALISSQLVRFDLENTDILKFIVKRSGWPTISSVGKDASNAAISVLQRADHDPDFQLRSLKMLEPLALQGEVSSQYAVTYDVIMIKLTGAQRYGTQGRCVEGSFQRYPLEDPERVEELRAPMDLGPMSAMDWLCRGSS
ncbi:hypothetical protein OIK40_11680 [Erythrobacter sp. sf7]|uniref:Uncharacterized protein n=1 Tax=Erythrobacter fulvus TaxID=2987523 RepID=A0ABT5JRT2_9SPHN|nr:DUF6624 domain-containing protein [Erythrobacter fulvus]MDC8755299.1 hypothetical protein [Erythrobacter fulvus]